MGPNYTVPLRRKREEKTNYKRRLALLKSRLPRLVIRKTLTGVTCQLIAYEPDGDKVVSTAKSQDLKEYGLTLINANVPVSYLTGLLIATNAKALKISNVVVDIGLQKLTKESRIYAAIRGAIDGGLKANADPAVFPSDDRVSGKHIENYAKVLAADKDAYAKQFSAYVNAKIDPATISSMYIKVKQAVLK